MSNFILGGRMGDLIHMLYVVKNTPGKHNLFITDRRDLHSDGFIYPLDKTIEELRPILEQQDYVNSIQAYNDEEAINLNMWRAHAYSTHWTQLLSNVFGVPVNSEAWIKISIPDFMGGTIVHCSTHQARRGDWRKVDLTDAVFIGSEDEYQLFGYQLHHFEPKTLTEIFHIIKNCKLFIGNQSLPLAIAHSLGVPRIAVLNEVDKIAYMGEENIYSNFSYVL